MPMIDRALIQGADAAGGAGLPRGILGGVVKALGTFFAR
jgi:hypothetical protein